LLTGFGFGANQAKFSLELSLPVIDINLSIVKNNSISCRPDHPAGSNDNFSKNVVVKIFSCLQNHIQRTDIQVPDYWNGGPTVSAERTFEEQMKTSFFITQIAQQISGVQSIPEEELEEEFVCSQVT
jgi:hypothetical protein